VAANKLVPPLQRLIRPLVDEIVPMKYGCCKLSLDLHPQNRTTLLSVVNSTDNGTLAHRGFDMSELVSAKPGITAMVGRPVMRYTPAITGTGLIDVGQPLVGQKRPSGHHPEGATRAKGAEVAINAAAGSITVTGSPAEVRHMETWVKTLSDQLSQQVQIDVNIYTVAVNSEENYSWNPSVIFKSAGNLGFNVTGVQTPAVIGGMTPFNIGASVINSSNYAGSTAALNALSTIGKVTEKLHQQAIAMNGQPTPVQLARQQSYLASSNSTTSANVGTTTSLTPGTFTVGFTAMFVPRIINGKIVLAMTMTNSALVSLKTVTSGSGSSQASIQTPDIDTSTFQNTVTLTPGDALLLTSLTKETGSNQNSGIFSPFFYLLGGGFDSTAGKQIMAIVVTAKVL
jgi:type IVB pilus formation R64 PilN family outer membrane protein